jgi:hypothetical protein
MKRLIVLVLVIVSGFSASLQAQLLLTPGQSYTYEFNSLAPYGNGLSSPYPNGHGRAIFYSDAAGSTPGASFTVDLFENDLSESPVGSATGSGNVSAVGPGAWHDFQGLARVTVNSGNVLLDSVVIDVFIPSGFGDYDQYSSGTVPVPEPTTTTLGALGVVGLVGWSFRKRRC